MSKKVAISLFKPLPPQIKLSEEAKRFNVVVTGRRVGKSEATWSVLKSSGAVSLPLIMPAVKGKLPVGIFAKDFKDLRVIWDGILVKYAELITHKDSTEHIIKFVGGGSIDMFTLTNEGRKESGRGRKFARIIVEETQKISDEVLKYWWNNVARATLLDYKGDAFFIANPNGQGTFLHQLARRGAGAGEPDLEVMPGSWGAWKSFRFTTYDNPLIDPAEIEEMIAELDPLSAQQEIFGKFVNYAGNIWCYAAKEPEAHARVFKTGMVINKAIPTVLSFDFNKRPMTALAMQFPAINFTSAADAQRLSTLIKAGISVVQEFKTNIETDASIYDTCQLVREWIFATWGLKVGNWRGIGQFPCTLPIFITGDASGNTTDGRQVNPMTYYEIICSELGLVQLNSVRIMSSNPAHADSFVKINTHFKSNPSFTIDAKNCPALVTDIFNVKSDKFRGIDKSNLHLSHFLDCLRYGVHNFA